METAQTASHPFDNDVSREERGYEQVSHKCGAPDRVRHVNVTPINVAQPVWTGLLQNRILIAVFDSHRLSMAPLLDTMTDLRAGRVWLPIHQLCTGHPGPQVPPVLVGLPHRLLQVGRLAKQGSQLRMLIRAPQVRAWWRKQRNTCQEEPVVTLMVRALHTVLIQLFWRKPSSTCLAPTALNLWNKTLLARCTGPLTRLISQW